LKVKDFRSAEDVLVSDLEIVCAHLKTEDSQFWRRSYCRSLMAFFEAVVADLAGHTLQFYDGVLGEGEKRSLRRRFGALARAFDAFDLFTNVAGTSTPLIPASEEWLVLEKAIRIRNRITHPVTPGDLEITDLDMAHLRVTGGVLLRITTQAHQRVAQALSKKSHLIRKLIKRRDKTIVRQNPGV
jgi:hypothetical protein